MGVASLTRAAVFLDRDGVLNRAVVGADGVSRPPADLASFELESGADVACGRLKEAGFELVVVTNQPDVARGTQRRAVVEALNAELMRRLPLDAIQVCYHDDGDHCDCRKPGPGMLLDAAGRLGLDLAHSVLVGDRWRDIEAGRRAGCATVLVGDGDGELVSRGLAADQCSASLLDAVDWILARSVTRETQQLTDRRQAAAPFCSRTRPRKALLNLCLLPITMRLPCLVADREGR